MDIRILHKHIHLHFKRITSNQMQPFTSAMFYLALLAMVMMLSMVYANIYESNFYVTVGCDLAYGDVIDTRSSVRSMTECAWHCSRNDQCLSVKYDRINTTCQLNAEQHGSLSCSAMLTYATIQKNTSTVSKLINVYCNESSECLVNNSQCFMNNCQCDPGYSYKQHDKESCVTSCDVYGSTFTTYDLHRLRGYNDKTLYNTASDEDCKSSCVSFTEFLCRTAEYNPENKKCHLSSQTAVTVSDRFEERESFYHHHRNCQ